MLEQQARAICLNQLRSVLPSYASCIYIRQPAPLGLGSRGVMRAGRRWARAILRTPRDDLIRSDVAAWRRWRRSTEASGQRPRVQVVATGHREVRIVAVEADRAVTSRVRSIIEKPKPAVAPSNLAWSPAIAGSGDLRALEKLSSAPVARFSSSTASRADARGKRCIPIAHRQAL